MQWLKKYKQEMMWFGAILLLSLALYFFVWKTDINKETVQNKNVQAFLKMIRWAEGTSNVYGYRTLFGGSLFNSFSDHPRKRFSFTQTDGKKNTTDAAGAYQFLSKTWDWVAGRLGLKDFSPENQDKAAIFLIKNRGALEDVIAGRFDVAVQKVSQEWASMPNSTYPQPKRTIADAKRIYEQNGGQYA